jgi:Domain of unknown function (DUF4129)
MTRDGIERSSAARALAPALIVLALIGIVAIAAAGSTPSGSNVVRAPHGSVVDTILTLFLVAAIPAAAIYIYGLLYAYEFSTHKGQNKLGFTVVPAILVLLATVVLYYRLRDRSASEEADEQPFARGFPGLRDDSGRAGSEYDPQFQWSAVAIVGAIVLVGFAVWYVSLRRQVRGLAGDDDVAGALAVVLEDTLDDLRAEQDPRRAVIAAYARLERVLAVFGVGRRPAETPQEYLGRILPRLELERRSVRRLTDLFTRAKFSLHEVDTGMKNEAIESLTVARDELLAAEERRRERKLAELEMAAGEPT